MAGNAVPTANSKTETAKDVLQVSFYGPFFFDFREAKGENRKVIIYAPRCPGHKAGIYSAKSERPIHGRYKWGNEYALEFKPTGTFSGEFSGANIVWAPPVQRPDQPLSNASFSLQVPAPLYVYGLNPSPSLEVLRADEQPEGRKSRKIESYATGLRFYYLVDLLQKVCLKPPGPPLGEFEFDRIPKHSKQLVRNSDLNIRYGSGDADDSEHEDATECFARIAKLVGLDWWICYNTTASTIRAGVDCAAPIVATKID